MYEIRNTIMTNLVKADATRQSLLGGIKLNSNLN